MRLAKALVLLRDILSSFVDLKKGKFRAIGGEEFCNAKTKPITLRLSYFFLYQ